VSAAPILAPAFPTITRGQVGALIPLGGQPQQIARVFGDGPEDWLPAPATPLSAGWWMVGLAAGPLRHEVRCHIGTSWEDATGLWRLLVWRPDGTGASMLPALEGVIGLRTEAGLSTLILDGRYRPPGGRAGAVADAAGLRRVAQSTAHRFVTDIAARIHDQGASS
jgi:hypothetical protein